MRYFLDTEFIEDGHTIDLISIGIVAEDGRTFYRQNRDCDFSQASDWVWRNVYPHLQHFALKGSPACLGLTIPISPGTVRHSYCSPECPWRSHREIASEVLDFMDVALYGRPKIWGYYADYDWVAFCQLFGTMTDLPVGFPMYCRDLKQLCVSVGDPPLPKVEGEHSALNDALWNQKIYSMLTTQPFGPAIFTAKPPAAGSP